VCSSDLTTRSVCPVCRALIPAKIVFAGESVYLLKRCTAHCHFRSLVERDKRRYLASFEVSKPAVYPLEVSHTSFEGCGRSCGLCPEHQQHTCLPIIEITDYCNMSCPVCLVKNTHRRHMSVADFSATIGALIRAEGTLDLINISGGEPTLHPELLTLIDCARRDEIVNISLSTNGRIFLKNQALLDGLIERGVYLSLQFDGFDDAIYREIRGEALLEEKLRLLELLEQAGAKASLVMTVVRGINEHHIGAMTDLLLEKAFLKSLMIQPIIFSNPGYAYDEEKAMTMSDVVSALGTTQGVDLHPDDITCLPCSHPACFSLAYLLKLQDGSFIPLTRLIDAREYLDVIKNRTTPGLDAASFDTVKEKIYELWSASGTVPDSEKILATVRSLLCELGRCGSDPDPRAVFSVAENNIKSIFIHSFMDHHTFDLSRAMKCCTQYAQLNDQQPCCIRNAAIRL
jgi:uncharacterized radical SAM superfamily Fe-S cluster-containing enzyme